ncbi:MAG: hypothetical protein LBT66_07165 [Methanobrevibacter sp.]|jgi:hypothetical protein|nr:hypothetical protein [Candidatus Methanovirga meridionalis]
MKIKIISIKIISFLVIVMLISSFVQSCSAMGDNIKQNNKYNKNNASTFNTGVQSIKNTISSNDIYNENSNDIANENNTNNHSILYVDDTSEEKHYKNLSSAIANSNDGDTIYVKSGLYNGSQNTNISVEHDLTIIGNNTNEIGIDNTRQNNTYFSSDVVFDGEHKDNFFTIDKNVNLKLSNLTFINGFSKNSGGAIINNGILTLNLSSFINNSISKKIDNSGIFDEDYGNTNPEDLEQTKDNLNVVGGAIYSNNQIEILNSNFESNNAGEYSKGGAIFNEGEKLNIKNTLFKINSAYDGGGAIYNKNGNLSIDQSTFELNTASTDTSLNGGGAISAENSNIKIDNSILIGNIATKSYGGAILNMDSSLSMNNNYFISNIAQGGDGGAIYSLRNHETNINGSLFVMNNASADGGAIYHKASKNYRIQNSVLINNTANRGGASYFGESEEIEVLDNSFLNNSVGSEGGAIYNSKSNVNLLHNEISANNAKVGGAVYSNLGSLNIHDSILRDNKAYSDGGAVYSSTNEMKIKNDFLINNSAENSGGAFYLTGSSNIVDNSTFAVNAVLKTGGAIYTTEPIDVHDSTFKANAAIEDGGAIWSGKTPSLKGNLYEKNMAGGYGGVLFSIQDKPSENPSYFNENDAAYGGDNYYTQSQKNNAHAAEYGTLAAMIIVTIATIVLSIIFGGSVIELLVVPIGVISGFHISYSAAVVLAYILGIIIVSGVGFGLLYLTEYLFDFVPEFEKFNERNPLVLPIITICILVLCFAGLAFVDLVILGAEGASVLAKIGNTAIQHIDDLVTIGVNVAKAGASTSKTSTFNNSNSPDLIEYLNEYQSNLPPPDNSNNFFKGISFKYNNVEIKLTDYNMSDLNMESYNNESGLCSFSFQATPKMPGYPMIYGKGTYNSINYYLDINLFTLLDDSSYLNVYSWEGYCLNLFNG